MHVSALSIVPCEPGIVPAFARLLDEYFATIEHEVGISDPFAAAAHYCVPPAMSWLAVSDSGLAGCVAVRPLTEDAMELKHLYVRPVMRGLGVGRRLLETVHTYAREHGAWYVYLDTLPSMTDAQELYRRAGYEICAPYRDEPVPKIFMRIRLHTPAPPSSS